jgi:hypothetical protein
MCTVFLVFNLMGNYIYAGSFGYQQMQMPQFILNPARDHYAGISKPCRTLQQARRSALDDACEQILSAMGAEYKLRFETTVSGEARKVARKLTDNLTVQAEWFLRDVENSIVRSAHSTDSGKHLFFVLVNYPRSKMEQMRKFSQGPHVSVKIIRRSKDKVLLRITESANVAVTFRQVRIITVGRLRLANFINLYVWKVQKTKRKSWLVDLDYAEIAQASRLVEIPLKNTWPRLLYSSRFTLQLRGRDQLGRLVKKTVEF